MATFSGYLYLNRGSYFHAASIEQLNYTTCDHNVHEILSKTFKYLQVQHIDNITLLGMSFAWCTLLVKEACTRTLLIVKSIPIVQYIHILYCYYGMHI